MIVLTSHNEQCWSNFKEIITSHATTCSSYQYVYDDVTATYLFFIFANIVWLTCCHTKKPEILLLYAQVSCDISLSLSHPFKYFVFFPFKFSLHTQSRKKYNIKNFATREWSWIRRELATAKKIIKRSEYKKEEECVCLLAMRRREREKKNQFSSQ